MSRRNSLFTLNAIIQSKNIQTIKQSLYVPVPFKQEGQQHLVESLLGVDRLVVDAVTDGVLLDVGCLPDHLFSIFFRHLRGHQFDVLAAFEVDKFGRPVRVVEVYLMPVMQGVEQDHLMLAVAQMPQGVHHGVLVVGIHQGIGKNNHKRPSVESFGSQMQSLGNAGGRRRLYRLLGFLSQFPFQYL